MTLCDDGHTEICFDRGRCPACELLTEKENLQDEIQDLKNEIDELKAEIEGLENQLG